MQAIRLLYVPNEAGDFRQLGFRRPLANLQQAGLLEALSVFSLQWRIRNGGDAEEHRQDLISRVAEFQPNVVLMQHLGSTGLRSRHFAAMRARAEFEFIYHEADPFSRYIHPLPHSARAAGRAADVVFTVGAGLFARNFSNAGAVDVRWIPSPFEPERFAFAPVSQSQERDHDVVVVANRNRPRVRGLPNWRDRIAFVELLQKRLGSRLAIYGKGWSGPGALGPVDFSRQSDAIRSGWVSANWDHFAGEAKYFSNRMSISLAAGSIHATTRHPGYEEIFPESSSRFLLLGDTQMGLCSAIEKLLDNTSPSERIAASVRAQEFSNEHFRQDDQLVSLLNYREERVNRNAASEAWDVSQSPLEGL